MSKSAIKALTEAASIAKCDPAFLTGFVIDKEFRKDGAWRNADSLAALIIDSVANAFQCENSTTLAKNGFRDIQHAIDSYVESNMDCWDGRSWVHTDVKDALRRLAEMVAANAEFEEREAAHTEALELNDLVDASVAYGTYSTNPNLTHIGIRNAIDRIREALLNLNRYPARFILKMMISVRRLTRLSNEAAQERYRQMMARPAAEGIDNEIPF